MKRMIVGLAAALLLAPACGGDSAAAEACRSLVDEFFPLAQQAVDAIDAGDRAGLEALTPDLDDLESRAASAGCPAAEFARLVAEDIDSLTASTDAGQAAVDALEQSGPFDYTISSTTTAAPDDVSSPVGSFRHPVEGLIRLERDGSGVIDQTPSDTTGLTDLEGFVTGVEWVMDGTMVTLSIPDTGATISGELANGNLVFSSDAWSCCEDDVVFERVSSGAAATTTTQPASTTTQPPAPSTSTSTTTTTVALALVDRICARADVDAIEFLLEATPEDAIVAPSDLGFEACLWSGDRGESILFLAALPEEVTLPEDSKELLASFGVNADDYRSLNSSVSTKPSGERALMLLASAVPDPREMDALRDSSSRLISGVFAELES